MTSAQATHIAIYEAEVDGARQAYRQIEQLTRSFVPADADNRGDRVHCGSIQALGDARAAARGRVALLEDSLARLSRQHGYVSPLLQTRPAWLYGAV